MLKKQCHHTLLGKKQNSKYCEGSRLGVSLNDFASPTLVKLGMIVGNAEIGLGGEVKPGFLPEQFQSDLLG